MASKENIVKENVAGKYYVDDQCISCELCVSTAPLCFKMAGDGSHAYVFSQPKGFEEGEACRESMGECPVFAIGDDGQ